MNTKIIVWAVGAVIVVIGGFFLFKSMNSGSAQNQNANATTTAQSGQVQGQEITVGTGATATPGSTVSVLYVGRLPDGTVFDSSAAHGNQPLTFVLGSEDMIAGFQVGVNGMKEGGERIIAIPPSLGYGAQEVKDTSGKVIIPANSTIVFNVQLVKVIASTSTTP